MRDTSPLWTLHTTLDERISLFSSAVISGVLGYVKACRDHGGSEDWWCEGCWCLNKCCNEAINLVNEMSLNPADRYEEHFTWMSRAHSSQTPRWASSPKSGCITLLFIHPLLKSKQPLPLETLSFSLFFIHHAHVNCRLFFHRFASLTPSVLLSVF